MSEVITYKNIALNWQPDGSESRQFNRILLAAIVLTLGFAGVISWVKVPETTWEQRTKVPDRVANYIAQQPKKIEPPIELPKPKPVPKPQPVQPKTEVTVSRQNPGNIDSNKPLTNTEQKARAVAQQSGLLALSAEMDELRDTSTVNQNLRARLNTAVPNEAATHKLEPSAVTGQAATVIDQDKVVGNVQTTELQTRDVQSITTATEKANIADAQAIKGNGGRGVSDVGTVFNKNKASLYALYERERRKNSGLKGRILFQLTIEPSGKVSSVKVVSSELNNPELEARILARIKLFVFAPAAGETVTVTYPVEFIPS